MNLSWIRSDGTTLLHDPVNGLYVDVRELEGFGIPDLDHLSERGPRMDGAVYIDTFFLERDLALAVTVRGATLAQYEDRLRTLEAKFSPKVDATLRVTTAGGATYDLAAHVSARTGLARQGELQGSLRIPLVGDNPYWISTTTNVESFSSSTGQGLIIPFTIPFTIALGTEAAQFTVDNSGDVEAWPNVTIEGPLSDPIISNLTTGKDLEFVGLTVDADEELHIDMAHKTVIVYNTVSTEESDAFGTKTAESEFWALQPGTNTVFISHAGGTAFSGELSWNDRLLAVGR